MSKRLQVLFDEGELMEVQRVARRRRMTTAEWVRRSLRAAIEAERQTDPRAKLEAVAIAVGHEFPTGDIDQLLAEIELGYGTGNEDLKGA